MSTFFKSPTYRIVRAMRMTGNSPGIIAQWKARVSEWAHRNPTGKNEAAVLAWLPLWQPRPFYTAAELVPIFPVLEVALGFSARPSHVKSAARLANELKFAGLPFFVKQGVTYFVVEQCHKAEEFENALG